MAMRRGSLFFFFNDTATTEIYTLSLHDALPIFLGGGVSSRLWRDVRENRGLAYHVGTALTLHRDAGVALDRKSTRLNSSHLVISYAVFCLKKKINKTYTWTPARHVYAKSNSLTS